MPQKNQAALLHVSVCLCVFVHVCVCVCVQLKKWRTIGRISHESAIVMPNLKTVYTTDDNPNGGTRSAFAGIHHWSLVDALWPPHVRMPSCRLHVPCAGLHGFSHLQRACNCSDAQV